MRVVSLVAITVLWTISVAAAEPGTGRVEGQVRLHVARDPRAVVQGWERASKAERERAARLLDPIVRYDPDSGGLAGAVVYLPRKPMGVIPEESRHAAVVTITPRGLFPRIAVVRVGQPITVGNLLDVESPIRWLPRHHRIWGRRVPAHAALPWTKFFSQPEPDPIRVDVDGKPAGAWIVLDHDFFAVTDARGRFEIKGLPPGRHHFRVVHPFAELRTTSLSVRVRAGKTTNVQLRPSELVLRRYGTTYDPIARSAPTEVATPTLAAVTARRPGWRTGFVPPDPHAIVDPFANVLLTTERRRRIARILPGLHSSSAARRRTALERLAPVLAWNDPGAERIAGDVAALLVDPDAGVRERAESLLGKLGTPGSRLAIEAAHAIVEDAPEHRLVQHFSGVTDPLVTALVPELVLRRSDFAVWLLPGSRRDVMTRAYVEAPHRPVVHRMMLAEYRREFEPLADTARFGTGYFVAFGLRTTVRETFAGRLASDDPREVADAVERVASLGPAAVDEVHVSLLRVVRGAAPPERRAALLVLRHAVHHEPVAATMWEVANDVLRPDGDRMAAYDALTAGHDADVLPEPWRSTVAAAADRLEQEFFRLRAIAELRAIIDAQRELRRRILERQYEELVQGRTGE